MLFSQLLLLMLPTLATTQSFISFDVSISKPNGSITEEQKSISVRITHQQFAGMIRYGISPRTRTCQLDSAAWTPSTQWIACGGGSNGFWVQLKRKGISDWLLNVLVMEWSWPPEQGPSLMKVFGTNVTLSSNTTSTNDRISCTGLSSGGGDVSCKLARSSEGLESESRYNYAFNSLQLTKFRLQKYPLGGSGTCQFAISGVFRNSSFTLPEVFQGLSRSAAPRSSNFTCNRSWPCRHGDGNFKIDIPCSDGFYSTLAYIEADRPTEKNREIWHITPRISAPLWFEGFTEMTVHFNHMLNVREVGVPLEPANPFCKNSVCDFPTSQYPMQINSITFDPERRSPAKGDECGGLGTPQCSAGRICKQQSGVGDVSESLLNYNQLGRCTKS